MNTQLLTQRAFCTKMEGVGRLLRLLVAGIIQHYLASLESALIGNCVSSCGLPKFQNSAFLEWASDVHQAESLFAFIKST